MATAYLAKLTLVKPAGATVSITRRTADSSNAVLITVNKNTQLELHDDTSSPLTWRNSWRSGVWRSGALR